MTFAEALLPWGPGVIAFVGAGGKTSAMFRLAGELAGAGASVLVTTTTHIFDPRLEPDRPRAEVRFHATMEAPYDGSALPGGRPGLTILLSREGEKAGKVKGVHPSWIPALRPAWPWILVEADGSKRLPIKAPAPYEPVLPEGADLVVGVMGLDCLGRPMDTRTVHRLECFQRVTGCAPGDPIAWTHLEALARHPEGLFKGAGKARALILNKADKAFSLPSRAQLAALPADLVLLCSLEAREGVIVSLRGERP